MKLLSIVGARPQFVKLAPLVREIELYNATGPADPVDHRIVHTGQHYDAAMSDVFFAQLDLPAAQFNLGVGSGPHGRQTGAMMEGIERILEGERPDLTVVYGDTNSTLAGALAASKLHMPTAHVEAGLRSFKRTMPEETNRVVADHVCDLLLAPTNTAIENLCREGLGQRAVLTGDLMHDSVLHYRALAQRESSVLQRLNVDPGSYGLVTLHRAENTDVVQRLFNVLTTLNQIARQGTTLVFPVHPRTASRISAELPGWRPDPKLMLVDPLGYLDTLQLLAHARVALTDSGGLQKEAFFVGCPCVTLRAETEWIETVEAHANVLVDADATKIHEAVRKWSRTHPRGQADFSNKAGAAFGHGNAARHTLRQLIGFATRGDQPVRRPAVATAEAHPI